MIENLVKKTRNKSNLKGAGPGRPKGSTNKFTDLKQAYLDIFEQIEEEGQEKGSIIKSFFKWVTKNDRNQGMFYQMLSKMLPSNVTVDGKLDVTFQASEKFMPKVKK